MKSRDTKYTKDVKRGDNIAIKSKMQWSFNIFSARARNENRLFFVRENCSLSFLQKTLTMFLDQFFFPFR